MPAEHRADARDARLQAVQRPGLAVRDQVGRLPGPGGRRATGEVRPLDPQPQGRARPTSRGCSRTPTWIEAARGDRRRRGRRARRGRPPGLRAAPGAARRRGARRTSSTRCSTCSTSTVARCSTSRSRTASACSRACSGRIRASASPRTSIGEGEAFYEAAAGPGPRGDHRQAPPLPVRARPSLDGLAQDQDPPRAGARGRWLDARRGQRQGSRRRGGRRLRRRPAPVQRQGRIGVRRPDATAHPRAPRAARDRRRRRSIRRRRATTAVGGAASCASVHWVRPELVIRAELGGWSRDGMVRQAAFKGIEEGRDPTTVTRERAGRDDRGGPDRGGGRAASRRRTGHAERRSRRERADGSLGRPARRRTPASATIDRAGRDRRRARSARRASARRASGRSAVATSS